MQPATALIIMRISEIASPTSTAYHGVVQHGSKASSASTTSSAAPDRATVRATQLAECPICFDGLCQQPCAILCSSFASASERPIRSCQHYFHMSCLQNLPQKNCPICRTAFERTEAIPSPLADPEGWFHAIDVDSNGHLSYEEVLRGLETAIELDWSKINSETDRRWGDWDPDESGEISLEEFMNKSNGLIQFLLANYPRNDRGPPPDITEDSSAWFRYWDEDSTDSLDKSEIVRALMKTFRIEHRKTDDIGRVVNSIWPIFDLDGNGTISYAEFISDGGLCDAIVAQLEFP